MINFNDPDDWEAIADLIIDKDGFYYNSSDRSHMTDMAQLVCEAIVKLEKERQ